MVKMSRKAWNNVVIFSMLLMIFFLNGLHYKLNPSDEALEVESVLPEQSFVLALAFPGYKIERIGTSWRIELPQGSDSRYSTEQLQQLIAKWQQLQVQVIKAPELEDQQALTVARFWLATEELPLSYQLFREGKYYYLFDKRGKRWFELEPAQAQALFLPIAISN
ncbi:MULTISPECIES: hypothetical protein [unclassified Pseudoalteromonas]|uniref:hypothetical protein n=1 Tax=unclassified Pseudoalteromonas TaxID=194690 RepID=UPI00301459FC